MKKVIALFLLTMFASMNYSIADSLNYEHISQPKKVAKKSPTNLVTTNSDSVTVMEYNVIEIFQKESDGVWRVVHSTWDKIRPYGK